MRDIETDDQNIKSIQGIKIENWSASDLLVSNIINYCIFTLTQVATTGNPPPPCPENDNHLGMKPCSYVSLSKPRF